MTCVTRMKPVEWHALAFALVDLCMRLSWRSALQGIPPFMTSHRAIKKKLSKNLLKPLFHRNYLEQFVPELFFPADLSAFPLRSKAGVFNLWGAPPLAAHCSRCVCLFVHYSLLCMCTWMGEMQSTNSQYGTPFLATCHLFHFNSLAL